MSDHDGFEQHDHPALAHNHGHYHVTHNYNEASGGFVHLSSRHDHEEAVRPTTAEKAAAAKAPAKKAAPAPAPVDNGVGRTVRARGAKKAG